jgi:hypothetical protein
MSWAISRVVLIGACAAPVHESELPDAAGSTTTASTSAAGDDAATASSSESSGGAESSSDAESSGSDDAAPVDDPDPTSEPRVRVAAGPTDDAERVETLMVARSEAEATRAVVLRLGAELLPQLRAGDRLRAAAELQVTTRCDLGQVAPGCDYDPKIRARLVLRGDDGEHPLGEPQTQTCTHGEHHCMFVFRPAEATANLVDALPCIARGDCRVELDAWAWDQGARAGGIDRVLVGENEGDYLQNGAVGGDKARLMVVRERELDDDERETIETTGGGALAVPTDASATVVYALRLDDLRAGEQLVVEAELVTTVAARARVSSLMFVTRDPDATDGGGPDGTSPKQIGEHNGINCTAGASPCTTRKVAVFEATADLDGASYVHVVVKSAVPGGGTTSVTVQRDQGWLRATRYPAALRG